MTHDEEMRQFEDLSVRVHAMVGLCGFSDVISIGGQPFMTPAEAAVVVDHAYAAGGMREVTEAECRWVLENASGWCWGYNLFYGLPRARFRLTTAGEEESPEVQERLGQVTDLLSNLLEFDMEQEAIPVATGKRRIPLMWWGNPVHETGFAVDEHVTFVDWAGVPIDLPDYRRIARVSAIDVPKRLRGAEASIAVAQRSRTPKHLLEQKARLDGRRR